MAPHPVSSTSDPAPPAEGLEPLTPGASATKANGVSGREKQGKAKDKKDKKAGGSGSGGGSLELAEPPEFFAERIKIFDEYKAKYDTWIAGQFAFSLARWW